MHMSRRKKKRKGANLPVTAGCAEYSCMTPMAAINYLSDGETGCCWAIIRHLYEKWHIAIPKPIQAFISIPEVWEAFLRMTAEQLSILLSSDTEGDPYL